MRPLPSSLVLMLLALGLALPGARAVDFVLFKNIWGDVIVATDTTTQGHALMPPTREEPVYYRGLSLGRKLGSIRGDKEPEVKEINRVVAGILATQGYLAARPGVHEPTLFLIVQWGYMEPAKNNLLWFFGYDPNEDIGAPVMEGILGPEVFRRDFRSHFRVGERERGLLQQKAQFVQVAFNRERSVSHHMRRFR